MRVQVRLYGTLASHAPSRRAGEAFDVELGEPATIDTLLTRLGVPADAVHLAIVNACIVHDRGRAIREEDRVGLFPAVGGG